MSRGRRRTVKGLIVLGSVLAFLSVFAIWIERQALNTDDWVSTSGKLLQNETIRAARRRLPGRPALRKRQRRKRTGRHPPRRHQGARRPGRRRRCARWPATAPKRCSKPRPRSRSGKTPTAPPTNSCSRCWKTRATRSRPKTANVSLNLGSLITNLASQVGIGASLAEKLPPDAGQIEILQSDELKTAQNIAVAIKGLALVLSILTFAAFGAAIYLSRDSRWVDRALQRHRPDRRRLRGDRRPPHRRRHRRRPAGQRRKRQARGGSGLVDRAPR